MEASIPYYEFVIKNDPKHHKGFCQLGIVYLEKGKLEKSAEYLK